MKHTRALGQSFNDNRCEVLRWGQKERIPGINDYRDGWIVLLSPDRDETGHRLERGSEKENYYTTMSVWRERVKCPSYVTPDSFLAKLLSESLV